MLGIIDVTESDKQGNSPETRYELEICLGRHRTAKQFFHKLNFKKSIELIQGLETDYIRP